MKIGISIPNNWGVEDVSRLIDLAARAEDRGFDSLWTSEHMINLAYVRDRIGDRPYYHPLSILSAIAARTERIALGTSVMVLPFHNPFDLAKYIATLDQISRGRVILGVGVGNVREEFDALGAPWHHRGTYTDEAIDVMKVLWSQQSASYSGKHWQFRDIHTSPKLYQRDCLPIWVGGMSMAARKRVIRAASGWQPTALTPDEFRNQVAELRDMATAANRNPDDIEMSMRFNIALDDDVVTETELRSTVRGDDMAGIIGTAETFAAAGAGHFIYALNSGNPDTLDAMVDKLGRELLPAFQR
jgi:probable F420-dependent oxidoreductase